MVFGVVCGASNSKQIGDTAQHNGSSTRGDTYKAYLLAFWLGKLNFWIHLVGKP